MQFPTCARAVKLMNKRFKDRRQPQSFQSRITVRFSVLSQVPVPLRTMLIRCPPGFVVFVFRSIAGFPQKKFQNIPLFRSTPSPQTFTLVKVHFNTPLAHGALSRVFQIFPHGRHHTAFSFHLEIPFLTPSSLWYFRTEAASVKALYFCKSGKQHMFKCAVHN